MVVRWRGGDEVARCLRSLLQDGGDLLHTIVLVDSGSDDGGAESLAAAFPAVEVVALPDNRSFAWAASKGVARTGTETVLLLNPDTEVRPGVVAGLATELELRPGLAGTVPLLVSETGADQARWQLRRLPTVGRLALGLGGAPQFPAGPPSQPSPVEQPAAAAWLVRRSAWDALGGLDPGFAPAWWEDVDFCARLCRARGGPAFSVVPQARVLHAGGSSLANLGEEAFLSAYYGNLLRYVERHHQDRLTTIRAVLRLTLRLRAAARPSRRAAYRAALGALASR